MHQKLSREEVAQQDRWEQRYGDKADISTPRIINFSDYGQFHQFLHGKPLELAEDEVCIGDEIYKKEDLQKAHEENPQHPSDPRKPHHYVLQNELTAMAKNKSQSLFDWNAEFEKAKKELEEHRERFPHLKPRKVTHP